jgi:NADP-dependent 3-hydroxy acid dehydrogenase YdfG
MAVARRFAVGGYRVTLVARSTDGLRNLAGTLADTGAKIGTIAADASDPDSLGTRMRELYLGSGAPGVIVYNAVMGAPDRLLSSSVAHLKAAYSVDVIGAIVVAQVAAPAMRSAGFGTILVTGGGFADHPIPALATVSLGKAALRESPSCRCATGMDPCALKSSKTVHKLLTCHFSLRPSSDNGWLPPRWRRCASSGPGRRPSGPWPCRKQGGLMQRS